MRRPGGVARPAGFLVLMLGIGLRLDTAWQGLAGIVLLLGGAVTAVGLWGLAREPRDRVLTGSGDENATAARGGGRGGSDCVPRSA